ncbi:hypothetical protein [Aggregatibacter segnis]|uniref:hypothetical protein n=1 Tax=Aggregatibacter segnis TaxID=739 RepID=UPI000D64E901|nr:hypothetical protein [Aggregatibacter segnis]
MTYALTKQVCQLNEQNIYVGQTSADLSPVEADDGIYLMPAGTIDVEPPKDKKGFIAKWTGGEWEYIENHIGETFYSTVTKLPLVISEFGAIPEGYTAIPPESELCEWDGKAWVISPEKLTALLEEKRVQLIDEIDKKAETIYSVWTRFEAEYKARKEAAEVFKASGYKGEPSIYITSFATPAGVDNKTATDIILQQAAGLQKLQDHLAALRMRKYELKHPNLTLEQLQAIRDDIIKQMDELMEAYNNG